jgi:hypothetical protein
MRAVGIKFPQRFVRDTGQKGDAKGVLRSPVVTAKAFARLRGGILGISAFEIDDGLAITSFDNTCGVKESITRITHRFNRREAVRRNLTPVVARTPARTMPVGTGA